MTKPPISAPRQARRGGLIGAIFRKEFRETFRERRTIMAVVIGPLLLTPALFALMGSLFSGQAQKAQARTYAVGVIGPASVPAAMRAAPHLRFIPATRADAERQIRTHRLNAAVMLPPDLEARLAAGDTAPLELLDDAGDSNSQAAAARLRALFSQVGQAVVARRLAARNLPPGFAAPFRVVETPIKSGGSAGMLVLSSLLPYLLIISAFSGTIYAAFDQVAGEKERGTLETLLVCPVSRRDIVLGKFAVIVAVCLISSVLTILGLGIAFGSGLHAFAWLAQGGVRLGGAAVGVTLLALLPMSALFGGLLLAVSTYARNQKEAQTLLGPLFTLIMVPAVMSMTMTSDIAPSLALVPVLNAALIIKQALAGSFDAGFIALAFLASLVYAAASLVFATRLFQNEAVLIKA